ncbi:hypothetical protein K9861_07830 [Lacticaseibacillus saniviri]|nr:hypothetical protein [Lacticaseibacillus saniviri]
MLYQAIQSPKTLMVFDEQNHAEEHCHMGALNYYNQQVFEWLANTL